MQTVRVPKDRETCRSLLWPGLPQIPQPLTAAVPTCCAAHTRSIRRLSKTNTVVIALADRASSSSEAVSDTLIVDFDEEAIRWA